MCDYCLNIVCELDKSHSLEETFLANRTIRFGQENPLGENYSSQQTHVTQVTAAMSHTTLINK